MIHARHDSDGRDLPARPGSAEGIYALEESFVVPPPLRGAVVALPTADEVIDRLAADLVVHAENCVRRFGDFHLALSGGAALDPLYARLMYDPNYRSLPWRRTHLWFVAEACVPASDERSTFRQINETIADHADIPPDQVHPMAADREGADLEYEGALRESLAWREKGHDRLDFVLLLLAGDGGVGGLRPGGRLLGERRRLVMFDTGRARRGATCLTMTPTLINAARFVAVYATGAANAGTIQRLAAGGALPHEVPVAAIMPLNGELWWYLDAEACG